MNTKKIIGFIILIIIIIGGVYLLSNKNMTNTDTNTANVLGTEEYAQESTPAVAGDVVILHYKGILEDGTQFDSSYDRGQPFGFILGQGMVIAGWDEGLIGAKKGDKKHLVIPGDKAYGDQEIKGSDGKILIPKNATLIFDVEVLEVVPASRVQEMIKAEAETQGTSTSQ